MSKVRLMIGVLLVLSLAGINAWQYWLKPAPQAPELSMLDINGKTLNLSTLKGQPILMSFWATSCGLCLMEINDLIALHDQYKAQGYTTISVALSYDSLPQIKAITQNRALPYEVVFDKKGDYAKAFGGVSMTPTHFLISPEGKIVWQNVGPINKAELQGLISAMLPEKTSV